MTNSLGLKFLLTILLCKVEGFFVVKEHLESKVSNEWLKSQTIGDPKSKDGPLKFTLDGLVK